MNKHAHTTGVTGSRDTAPSSSHKKRYCGFLISLSHKELQPQSLQLLLLPIYLAFSPQSCDYVSHGFHSCMSPVAETYYSMYFSITVTFGAVFYMLYAVLSLSRMSLSVCDSLHKGWIPAMS